MQFNSYFYTIKQQFKMENIISVTPFGETKTTELQASPVEIDFTKVENTLSQISEMKRGLSLTPRYMEFSKVGEKTRGVFLGFKILTKKEADGILKNLPTALWADEEKNVWCNGGVSFISGFVTQNPDGSVFEMAKGTPFEAELIELKPVGAGKVKVFAIYRLS
jgi:hypothetical protein